MPFYFPSFRPPYFHHYPSYKIGHYSASNAYIPKDSEEEHTEKNRIADTTSNNTISNLLSFIPTSIGPLSIHPEGFTDKDKPVFEMFGICLFLDDIIIICLLIFLYQEHVTDQMLYVCLFLLLIS